MLATPIPRTVRVSEAPSYGQTVLQYDPSSPGSRAYLAAAREFARGGIEANEAVDSSAEGSVEIDPTETAGTMRHPAGGFGRHW